MEEEILVLHGKDITKVELHMDNVSTYTSKSTAVDLAKTISQTRINCAPFKGTPVNLFDDSTMDVSAFGYLERKFGKL